MLKPEIEGPFGCASIFDNLEKMFSLTVSERSVWKLMRVFLYYFDGGVGGLLGFPTYLAH